MLDSPSPKRADKRKSREYIPTRRSGAYALLLALLKHSNEKGFLKKLELMDFAQQYADVSFTQADVLNSQYYNAWSAMGGLIKKGLVTKGGNPARYELTDCGRDLAIKLQLTEEEFGKSSDSKKKQQLTSSSSKREQPGEVLASGSSYNSVARRVPPTPFLLKEPEIQDKNGDIIALDDVVQIEDDEFDLYPLENPLPTREKNDIHIHPTVDEPQEEEEPAIVNALDDVHPIDGISHNRIVLTPDEYDIFLCVDHAEVSGFVLILRVVLTSL